MVALVSVVEYPLSPALKWALFGLYANLAKAKAIGYPKARSPCIIKDPEIEKDTFPRNLIG